MTKKQIKKPTKKKSTKMHERQLVRASSSSESFSNNVDSQQIVD